MTNATGEQPSPDAMRELRLQMLTTPAAKFGIEPTSDFPVVYGVVMDWPIAENIATVVSFCDGNASLYTTSTFGVIGGFGHESVRVQARNFVAVAAKFLDAATPVSEFPYPESDRVRYYLLTFDGVKMIDADMEAVTSNQHESTELFAYGQQVLTELRTVSETDSETEEMSEVPRGKLSGAPGYVNCLLTAMSEGVVRSIDLVASRPVPNLVELTAGHGDTQEWIKEQHFAYGSIRAKEVIQLIKQNAEIGGMPFFTRRGDLPTIHAKSDGTGIARVFDISIGPFSRWAKVELAPAHDPRVIALQRDADARNAS
jgi:hypothetical protein